MQIATILNFLKNNKYKMTFFGNEQVEVRNYCSLNNLQNNSITWIKSKSNIIPQIEESLVNYEGILFVVGDEKLVNKRQNYIVVDNPKAVFFKILSHFFKIDYKTGISEDSVVETVQIGKNVFIGHHCYIHQEVEIAEGVRIENNVSIDAPCKIGKNTIIHSGVVIGTDGFGYYQEDGLNKKVPHFGGVIIGEDVEIGANTCIDRGTMDDTIISNNVKIDNLCHIGHNVFIAENSMLIAGSVLGGSCCIEKDSYIGMGGIVRNQIIIAENTMVGMGAVVTKTTEKNKVVAGVPAKALYDNI